MSLNLNLCLVCQCEKEETLVENPRASFETLFQAIVARASYGETKYTHIFSQLKDVSPEDSRYAKWHRKCYQEVTHSGMLKRSKER